MICSKLQQVLLGIFTRDTRLLPKVSSFKLAIVYYQVGRYLAR